MAEPLTRERFQEIVAAILSVSQPAAIILFGSYARDDAGPASDIDVFVDPAPNKVFGFLPFMDAFETIQHAVGDKVDYGTRKGLHPLLRLEIEREALRIF